MAGMCLPVSHSSAFLQPCVIASRNRLYSMCMCNDVIAWYYNTKIHEIGQITQIWKEANQTPDECVCAGAVCFCQCVIDSLIFFCSQAFWHPSLPPTSIKDVKCYSSGHRWSI